MRVDFRREEHALAADVLVAIWSNIWVPAVAGEVAIGGLEEEVALLVVLADEQDEGRVLATAERRAPPPPRQEGVVAPELVVVLVETTGAVVLDEDEPARIVGLGARDLHDRVRADGSGTIVV